MLLTSKDVINLLGKHRMEELAGRTPVRFDGCTTPYNQAINSGGGRNER